MLLINYSPSVALNRTYALYKADGREIALREAAKLNLPGNRFYHLLMGELYGTKDAAAAEMHLQKALALAKTDTEKRLIEEKIGKLHG